LHAEHPNEVRHALTRQKGVVFSGAAMVGKWTKGRSQIRRLPTGALPGGAAQITPVNEDEEIARLKALERLKDGLVKDFRGTPLLPVAELSRHTTDTKFLVSTKRSARRPTVRHQHRAGICDGDVEANMHLHTTTVVRPVVHSALVDGRRIHALRGQALDKQVATVTSVGAFGGRMGPNITTQNCLSPSASQCAMRSSRSWRASQSCGPPLPGEEQWRMKQIARGVSSSENERKPQVQHIINTEFDVARMLEDRKDFVEVMTTDDSIHTAKEDWLFIPKGSNNFESVSVSGQKAQSVPGRKRTLRSTWTATGRFLCDDAMVTSGPRLPASRISSAAQTLPTRMTRADMTEERIISAASEEKPPPPQLFVKPSLPAVVFGAPK